MSRPPVTVAFPCFQQVEYVGAALESVLAQDYSPLEVVVSDDGSTDGSFETIERVVAAYDGPHEVRVNRNDTKQGVENYNTLMGMARGGIVVIAHSDDISRPHRVSRIVAEFERHRVSMVSSNADNIGPDDEPRGRLLTRGADVDQSPLAIVQRGWHGTAHGAALAWTRDVFDRFGPLDARLSPFQTDWILPFRASLLRGLRFIDEPLILRRLHDRARGTAHLHYQRDRKRQHQEAVMATAVAQNIYRIVTLREFMRRYPDRAPGLRETAAALDTSLLQATGHWSDVRNRLALEGLRPRWESIHDST